MLGCLSSMGLHSLFFFALTSKPNAPKPEVSFHGNILKLSLTGAKIKKANPDPMEEAGTQVETGTKAVTSGKSSQGEDKLDAAGCFNLKVHQELKAFGISLPRRYFVQVYTKNAAVDGAWFVDKWMSEKPSSQSVDKRFFEVFSECIRNSNFSEWGRKAVNYAHGERSISFAVEFND